MEDLEKALSASVTLLEAGEADIAVELSSVNLMVVSDHGMAQISEKRTINLTEVLVPEDYVTILGYCSVTSIYTTAENENQI
nr:hypothetical protein BaRGS_014957 [Batillaria attramentaria]